MCKFNVCVLHLSILTLRICAFSSQGQKSRMCKFNVCVHHSYRINRSTDCDEKCEKIKEEISEISKC